MKQKRKKIAKQPDKPYFFEVINRFKRAGNLKNDGAVASALGMPPSNYSDRKKRGSLPCKEILIYCLKERLSTDWIFFGEAEFLNKFLKAIHGDSQLTELMGKVVDIYVTSRNAERWQLVGMIEDLFSKLKERGEKNHLKLPL